MSIIYQKSVFQIEGKLKKDCIKGDYFQLEKIHNLRIIDDKEIIRRIRKKNGIRHKELSKFLETTERNFYRWERGERAIPYNKFLNLMNRLKINYKERIKDCYFCLGGHHGGWKVKLPLKLEEFLLAKYLVPQGESRVYVVKSAPKNIKEKIIRDFKVDRYAFEKTGLLNIYSELLNNFLKTFYDYKKVYRLKFPLTEEISELESVDLNKAVIIPSLLTDGGERPSNRLSFFGASKRLHDLWSDAVFKVYKLYPSSYLLERDSIYITTHIVSDGILNELKQICPTFKTCPAKKEIPDYLKKSQPSIRYLYNSKKLEQEIAIRIWASTEGNTGITLDANTGLIVPVLKIACAHPELIKQLRFICKKNGMNMSIAKEKKNWSGYGSLISKSIRNAVSFLKMGGFISDVAIAKSRSKHFGGLDKQEVLLGIFEFMIKQRRNAKYKVKNREEAYGFIRKIVINKEFKDADYYIGLFGKGFNNWYFRNEK